MVEVEHIEQVANRRAIQRDVRVTFAETGFGKLSRLRLVSGLKPQFLSNELQDRDMIRISVVDVTTLREV
jgi:hypothetical protein